MEKTNNGFDIADQDLRLRGPGDMLGPKQAGFYQYKIANLVFDKVIIIEAREVAFDIVEKDPNLEKESHRLLKDNFMKNYSHHLNDLKLI